MLLEWLKQIKANSTKCWQGCTEIPIHTGWSANSTVIWENSLAASYRAKYIIHHCHVTQTFYSFVFTANK